MRVVTALLLSCLPLAAWPGATQAQVRRCTTAAGNTVYTDKACRDIGAVERVPRDDDTHAASLHRRQCSRTLQDLTFELTMAIDGRDANRLAALYHWPGMSTRSGYALMERLDAIAQRPLVDVRPLFASDDASAPATATATSAATQGAPAATTPPSSSELLRRATPWRPAAGASADAPVAPAGAATATAPPAAPVARRRAPYAIQVDQTLANAGTPSRTVFGLRRHLDCWWISL